MYIVAPESTGSAVLVEERNVEGTVKQVPIYFVSEALSRSKLLYSEMERLAYFIAMAKRKLRQYFEAHQIIIPTSYPLKDIFRNRESLRRIAKWTTELAEYTIEVTSFGWQTGLRAPNQLSRQYHPKLGKYTVTTHTVTKGSGPRQS